MIQPLFFPVIFKLISAVMRLEPELEDVHLILGPHIHKSVNLKLIRRETI